MWFSSFCRCVLTGETTAGKTSLMNSLIAGQSRLTAMEDRTQVLGVETWNISGNQSYQMYDTGGHAIYDAISTFFVSSTAYILLVHDLSEPSSVDRTLNVLRRHLYQHPNNSITFVLTHIDLLDPKTFQKNFDDFREKTKDLIQKEIAVLSLLLQGKFEMEQFEQSRANKLQEIYRDKIKDNRYFAISCETMAGVPELKDFLIAKLSQSTKVNIPGKWIRCFQLLHSGNKNFYSFSEFEKCYCQGVKGIQKILTSKTQTKESATTLMNYLSKVGLILTFPDHPLLCDYIFHDNQFIISLFKSIFDHSLSSRYSYWQDQSLQALFQENEFEEALSDFINNGLLTHKLLRFLWSKYGLAEKDELALVEALKMFDIFYPVQDVCDVPDINKLQYFIPWFVTKKEAPRIVSHPGPLCYGNIILKLEYLFHVEIPVNVTEQMCVRLQKYAVEHNYKGERYAWSDGLLVTLGRVQMIVKRETKAKICITVEGELQDLHEMWISLKDLYGEQESVIKCWKGIVKQSGICCFHCILTGKGDPHKWNAENVFDPGARYSGQTVKCPKDDSKILPIGLTHPLCPGWFSN